MLRGRGRARIHTADQTSVRPGAPGRRTIFRNSTLGPLRWAPSGPKLWDMKANNSAVLAAARRVAAVRAELSEAERWASEGRPGARAMVGALKSDLRVLESRLATM